ncbi:uncharacterized protein LOC122238602 [Panthera tigris]|uniref:uncharacterized protein LOC122238602 n=1 Tax=Panthera tigris TaxID=9694 RepID=UPI001C6F7E0B|nr:uncharacterized protein LOC122238602 [Panthera tigris]
MRDYLFQDQSLSQTQPHSPCLEPMTLKFKVEVKAGPHFQPPLHPEKPQRLGPRPRPEGTCFNWPFEPQGGVGQSQREAGKSHVRYTRPHPNPLTGATCWSLSLWSPWAAPALGFSGLSTGACQVSQGAKTTPSPLTARREVIGLLHGEHLLSCAGRWCAPYRSQSTTFKGKGRQQPVRMSRHILPRGFGRCLNVGAWGGAWKEREPWTLLAFQGFFPWGDLGTLSSLIEGKGKSTRGPEMLELWGWSLLLVLPLNHRVASDNSPPRNSLASPCPSQSALGKLQSQRLDMTGLYKSPRSLNCRVLYLLLAEQRGHQQATLLRPFLACPQACWCHRIPATSGA